MRARAFFGAVTLAVALAGEARGDAAGPPMTEGVGVEERLGAALPRDLALTTPTGTQVRSSEVFLSEMPTLLVLAYSDCPMLCNLVLRGLAYAVRGTTARPGADFRLLTLSIDPNESAERAAATRRSLVAAAGYPGDESRWEYLLGTGEATSAVADAVGFRYRYDPRSKQWAHPAVVIVLTPEGFVSQYLYGLQLDPAELDAAIVLARSGGQRASAAIRNAATCFRFDPASTKYAGAIRVGLRLTGGFAVAGLVLAVVLASRRWRGT